MILLGFGVICYAFYWFDIVYEWFKRNSQESKEYNEARRKAKHKKRMESLNPKQESKRDKDTFDNFKERMF